MIQLEKLSKRFGSHYALRGISAEIPSGSIYGLVGSNGSGKSTLLRLIAGIYQANQGKVSIDGTEVFEHPEIKQRMFYISDDQYIEINSTIEEMAQLYSQIYPDYDVKLALDMAKSFDLDTSAKFKTFSKGMQRQAHIILGLAAKPAVLLCDETFDGLDPVKRRGVKQIFSRMVVDYGTTVLIASHNLRELEEICDHIALLHKGQLIFERSLEDVESNIFKVQTAFNRVRRREDFAALAPMTFEQRGRMIAMLVRGDAQQILTAVQQMEPLYVEILPLTLEEIFIGEMEVLGYDIQEIVQ